MREKRSFGLIRIKLAYLGLKSKLNFNISLKFLPKRGEPGTKKPGQARIFV
jgi:hypothetical protein